jgi:hypothetical protein
MDRIHVYVLCTHVYIHICNYHPGLDCTRTACRPDHAYIKQMPSKASIANHLEGPVLLADSDRVLTRLVPAHRPRPCSWLCPTAHGPCWPLAWSSLSPVHPLVAEPGI